MSTGAPSSMFAERAVILSPLRGWSGGSVVTLLQTSVKRVAVMSRISWRIRICYSLYLILPRDNGGEGGRGELEGVDNKGGSRWPFELNIDQMHYILSQER